MGVRFLETFLERHSRQACYRVDIRRLVHEYREKTRLEPVVVVDGMSCLRPLYGKLSWLNGGQYKEFYEVVQNFIVTFTQLGCRLVVYFDGPVQEIKLSTWKKRRIESGEVISAIFDQLYLGTEYIEHNCRKSCLPNGIGWIFLFLLSQHEKCSIITSIKECDEEIAKYSFNNKCFAILAQDTDYVVYRAAHYYLSVKNLDLNSMTTFCYDGNQLSAELGIPNSQLPLLASLVGNDIVDYDLLKGFHSYIKRKFGSRDVIRSVAEYIRGLWRYDLSGISMKVFGTCDKADLLQKSINSYDLTKLSSNDATAEQDTVFESSEWSEIVQLAKKKYIESFYPAPLYDIIVKQRLCSSTCLEDYRPEKVVPIGNLLKDLRRHIYGILLFEKPLEKGQKENYVLELVMTGIQSMEEEELVKPKYLTKTKHPGLINLWTSKLKYIEETRWKILCEIFKTDLNQLHRIPHWLLIPALATKYFKEQYQDLEEWELDTLIATNVCVRSYNAYDLSKLPSGPLTYRSIWLYTAITRTYSFVNNLLFFIGDPVPHKNLIYHHYADGKLFHYKYRLSSSSTPSSSNLCEHRVDNIELFNLLKSFIMG